MSCLTKIVLPPARVMVVDSRNPSGLPVAASTARASSPPKNARS
jgi:hypothetical protein